MSRDRVAGIVIKDDQVLLMFRRNKGKEYYTFPGGGIDPGETREQALKRELWEETSIEAVAERTLYDVRWDGSSGQTFFLCRWSAGEPALGDFVEKEVMKADPDQYYEPMWRPLESLPRLLVYPLEVKDMFVKDFRAGWPPMPILMELKLSTCRQTL